MKEVINTCYILEAIYELFVGYLNLNMKALEGAFNQEKALLQAFSIWFWKFIDRLQLY